MRPRLEAAPADRRYNSSLGQADPLIETAAAESVVATRPAALFIHDSRTFP